MKEREPDFTRVGRKKERNKSNKILNLLIGAVIIAIVVVAITLFTGGKTDEKATEEDANNSIEKDDSTLKDEESSDSSESASENLSETETETETAGTNASESSDSNASTAESQKEDDKLEDEQVPEEITVVPSEDSTVSQSIIDDSWKPVGTSQTGDHVSLYDGESVDWNEKKQALAYATGLPVESMIFWKIKNGGGPQKSIGIVSSRDSKEKYRVYLEWVNGEGWKPVKKDILTTLEVND